MKLLIIEDEQNIALPLKRVLEKQGFAVDYAANGKEGLESAEINNYDCILLDLNLPEIDGIELARRLRDQDNSTPIIMVTARSQIYDKLTGFDHGADDYVTKPFSTEELIARINAVIKRNSVNKQEELTASGFKLVPAQNKVVFESGKEELLSNKETNILEYLLRNRGKAVSTEELLEHVWDSEVDLFTETVKTHIKTLRQKVDPQKKLIKTIRGKGYLVS